MVTGSSKPTEVKLPFVNFIESCDLDFISVKADLPVPSGLAPTCTW